MEISDYIDKKLIIKAGGASEKDIEAVKDNEKYVGLCFAKDSVFGAPLLSCLLPPTRT